MKNKTIKWFGGGTLALVLVLWMSTRAEWPDGPIAEFEPQQGPILAKNERPHTSFEGFSIEGVASYKITARVLSVESYSDEMAPAVPRDVALGWGRMSDRRVIEKLNISQDLRWYSYRWGREGPPIPAGEIMVSSANTHLVVVDPELRSEVARIREKDLVTLTGWLAHVSSPQGAFMQSSISRRDTDGGACEVLWVTSIKRQSPK